MASGPVLVGLSGGVDSAIAAWQLLEDGHAVEALFMKNWEEDDTESYCAAATDLEDAQAVCARLDIPLHTVNFAAEYWDRVFQIFLQEYQAGRTPNPDVLCNREIKFQLFIAHAIRLGADGIATGHYADVRHNGRSELLMAADQDKDQTYFLHLLEQAQLNQVHFPLAAWRKTDVRAQARRLSLPVHDKKDSTGICFIGERRFRDFLEGYIAKDPGEIVNEQGQNIGEHTGLAFYTLGQRKGLGIGGVADAWESPWYVLEKDFDRNQLIVTQDREHPDLNCTDIPVAAPHWIAGTPPDTNRLQARIRHRQTLQPCTLDSNNKNFSVRFETPQWSPAPGQSVVFYDDTVCLGGAVITEGATHT